MPVCAERLAVIAHLAEEQEDRLLALVRKNDRIFLDPSKVDVSSPLPRQLVQYLTTVDDEAIIADFETALRTGAIVGAADGDADDSDDDLLLDEGWRDEPCTAWAAALSAAGRQAENEGVVTPEGECVGPVPVAQWLSRSLPSVQALIESKGGSGGAPTPPLVAARELAHDLATEVRFELRGRRSSFHRALPKLLPKLLLVSSSNRQPQLLCRVPPSHSTCPVSPSGSTVGALLARAGARGCRRAPSRR